MEQGVGYPLQEGRTGSAESAVNTIYRSKMSADNQNQILNLQGLVRYILSTTDTGEEILNARYVSSRLLQSFQASSAGHGIRQGPNAETRTGFEGNWEIKYFEPTGELAVTAFALKIEKAGEVSCTGTGKN